MDYIYQEMEYQENGLYLPNFDKLREGISDIKLLKEIADLEQFQTKIQFQGFDSVGILFILCDCGHYDVLEVNTLKGETLQDAVNNILEYSDFALCSECLYMNF